MPKKNFFFPIVILLFDVISYCVCARILCLFPIPSISHQIVFIPLTQELAKRGHELVIATPNPTYTSSPNIQEVDLKDGYILWKKMLNFNKMTERGIFKALKSYEECYKKLMEQQLSHKDIQKIFKNESEHFDLILVEYIVYPLAHAIRKKYNARLIGITSMDVTLYAHKTVKNLVAPYIYPNSHVNSNLFTRTYVERMQRIVEQLIFFYTYSALVPSHIDLMYKYIGDFEDSFYSLDNLDLLLVNAHPALGYSKPVVPTFIDITGIHIQPVKTLPTEIQTFLDSDSEGVIVFSLGTNVKSGLLTDDIKKKIFQAFSDMPSYNVICKWEANVENMKVPKNVRLFKWIPQNDILAHPNVKIFLFQGGYQSMVEAVTYGVPMLGIPFSAEQTLNTQIVTHLGIGRKLEVKEINETILKDNLLSILQNQTYYETVSRLSKQLYDNPQTPLERAVWWTEYVLRNNGTKHLQPLVEELNLYDLVNIEIIIVCIVLICILVLVVKIIYSICKCFTHAKKNRNARIGNNMNDKKNE